MTAEHSAIVQAYESEDMSPVDISNDRGLELSAVKAVLMQESSKYRKDCGKEDEANDGLNFSNDDLQRVNQVILDIALGAEDEHLRLKAATYVRDDKKGRKEIVKNMGGQNFNILFLNEQIKKVRQVADGVKRAVMDAPMHSQQKAINV